MSDAVAEFTVDPPRKLRNRSLWGFLRRRPQERTPPEPIEQLKQALDDAEMLLRYAAETGIAVEDQAVGVIVKARVSANQSQWGGEAPEKLIAALTVLSNATKPVTAASLRASSLRAGASLSGYRRMAILLAFFIVPVSIASFICAGLSSAITRDVSEGNALALSLVGYVSAPGIDKPAGQPAGKAAAELSPEARPKLQQLTILTRAIDNRAEWLNRFAFWLASDPQMDEARSDKKRKANFELPVGSKEDPIDLPKEVRTKVEFYQDVRFYASRTQETAQLIYGAVAASILPALYALLGACASLLRTFADQTRARTFVASEANRARFLIAAIAGLVIGLFSNFTLQQGGSLSPFGIAFLVGYASDAFFSFLDTTLTTVSKPKN